jgi:hypothetical protein
MVSIARAFSSRRILLLALLACCLFTLKVQAQTVPLPQFVAVLCGGAGQSCCPFNTCNSGLVCNSNGICRNPCGAAGQRCCDGTCNAGLACNSRNICRTCGGSGLACDLNTNTCRVCGFLGTFCCPYAPQCSEGTCKVPGTCQ